MAQPHSVKLAAVRGKRDFDIAQAFAPGQLGERHDAKLLSAIHTPDAGVTGITVHNTVKARPRNEVHHLSENRLADVHAISPGSGASIQGGIRRKGRLAFQIDTKITSPFSLKTQRFTAKPPDLTGQHWRREGIY